MAEGNKTQAHLLKYTGEGLNSILDRADTVIKTAQNNEKYYIRPYEGGIGPVVPQTNSVLVGGDDNKIKNIPSTSGAFYSQSKDSAPQFGVLPVDCGGTNVKSYSELRKSLGLGENTTGALKVENGGTGITNPESNKILATATGSYAFISPAAEGTVLISNGPDKLPTFQTIKSISSNTDFGTINTGTWRGDTIAVLYGGTGVNNLDDLSSNLGLNTTTSPIGVQRGGTGVNSLNDLKKNLAIQFTDISMNNSIIAESNGGTGHSSLQSAFNDKIKIDLTSSSVLDGVLPVEKGGTGQSTKDDLALYLNSILNLGMSPYLPISITRGGTGVESYDELSNALQLGETILDAIPIARGGTGATTLKEAQTNLGILSSEQIENKITEMIPLAKETLIKNNISSNITISADDIANKNVIILTTNTNKINITLNTNDQVLNGTEVKIIKNGLGEVTVNGSDSPLEAKISTFIYIEGNWYN